MVGGGPRRGSGAEFTVLVAVGVVLLTASLLLGLNGDVQYVIGGMRVAVGPDGALTGVDTFTHRPLVYRAFILGLTGFLGLLQLSPAGQVPFEISARLVAATLSLAAGMLLFLGVRPRLGAVHAGAVALAVTASLALAPNWDLLQAEWLGCLLAVLAVALALLPASRLIAGALGGLLLVLAAAAKLSTAPYALIGLLAIAALDRRRTIPVVLGGATFGLAFVGLLLVVPHELRWLRDTVTLSLGSPLHTATNWGLMASALGSKAATSPVLIVAPASLVVLLRLVRQRSRWWLVIGALLVFALAAAPLVAQKEAYLYRLSILPVAGAALVAFAAVELWSTGGRFPWWVIGALAVVSGIAAILLSLPTDVRTAQTGSLLAVVGGLTVALAVAAWFIPRPGSVPRPRLSRGALLAAVAIGAIGLPVVLPSAAWSLDPARTRATNASWEANSHASRARLEALSARIGPASSVLYLAYGSVGYHMGNPVMCRYPSPVFLKVGGREASVTRTPSYADNLDCVLETDADWLIVEPGWLSVDQLPDAARQVLDERFDCSRALNDGSGILACPAR